MLLVFIYGRSPWSVCELDLDPYVVDAVVAVTVMSVLLLVLK